MLMLGNFLLARKHRHEVKTFQGYLTYLIIFLCMCINYICVDICVFLLLYLQEVESE